MKTHQIFIVSLVIWAISGETLEETSGKPPETSTNFNDSSIFTSDLCDLVTEVGICLFNGEKVLTADAQPKGLIGHWSFDDAYVNPPIFYYFS